MYPSTKILWLSIALIPTLMDVLSPVGLRAQEDTPHVTHLSTAHGLSNTIIWAIVQDRQGFLWIGTRDGLNRYDGYSFKIYKHDPADSTSLSCNRVNAICEDRTGMLWIGTHNGLSCFDPRTEKFTRYQHVPKDSHSLSGARVKTIYEDRAGTIWVGTIGVDNDGGLHKFNRDTGKFTRYRYDPDNPNSVSNNWLNCILEDSSGALWLGSGKGLNKFDPVTEQFTHYLLPVDSLDWINTGYKDRTGMLWFGTADGGLNQVDPKLEKFRHYSHDPHDPASLSADFLVGIFEARDGSFWVGTAAGVDRLDRQTGKFLPQVISPRGRKINSNTVHVIFEDRSGVFWVGTRNNGVFRYDRKPQRFSHYQHDPQEPTNLAKNDIYALYEDRSGRIWIAFSNGAVDRFDPGTEIFTYIIKEDELHLPAMSNQEIESICEEKAGNMWFGIKNGGLCKWNSDDGSLTHYQHDPKDPGSLSHDDVISIYEDRDETLCVGAVNGLNKFDRRTQRFTHFRAYLPEWYGKSNKNIVWKIQEDRRGNLWVTMCAGVNLFDRRAEKFIEIKTEPRFPEFFNPAFYEDRSGTIWISCRSFGLFRIDPHTKSATRFNVIEQVDAAAPSNWIISFSDDPSGMLWLGSLCGLHKFDPRAERFVAHYYEQDGLPGGNIFNVIGDEEGKLWILTSRGLSILNEQEAPKKRFRSFDIQGKVDNNAFVGVTFTRFLRSKNGDIYWGGVNGLYRFYPNHIKSNSHIPPIVLTEFRLFNEPVKLGAAISAAKRLTLSHRQNFFSFSFAALDYTNAHKNQFAYKLEGFDKEWIYCGSKHEANYTNVPPGEYEFRVKGSNSDGVWNEEGASVKIIITPPFWQTWWFRVSIALAVIAILAALYSYRVSNLLKIERMRLQIARDLHDDVGSSLSSIALTTEMLQKELATNGLVNRQLARVHTTAQKLSRNLKEIVWVIDPQRDKLDDLLLHTKEAANELLGQKGIAYTFNMPQKDLPQSLKMEFRRNLFMIYKEMLHNVVQHAEATKVEIALTKSSGMLQLQVADNGKGFIAETAGNGNGLQSMRARAGELHGRLEIKSQPEQGTTVTLSVKI